MWKADSGVFADVNYWFGASEYWDCQVAGPVFMPVGELDLQTSAGDTFHSLEAQLDHPQIAADQSVNGKLQGATSELASLLFSKQRRP